MQLRDTKLNWELFGKLDPFRAILHTAAGEGEWDLERFFKTGQQEVDAHLKLLGRLGLEIPAHDSLDFGCGVGRLTQALCSHFDRCTGVDIAESMIELANRLNQHPDQCQYVVNDKPNLSYFADESFDLVLSIIVLQHINPRYSRRYIREFLRVLRPGGVAVFQVPASRRAGVDKSPMPPNAYRAKINCRTKVKALRTGERFPIQIRTTNVSDMTWPAAAKIRVGNHWRGVQRSIQDDGRVDLDIDLPPRKSRDVTLWVTAPAVGGKYLLVFDLVQEGVTWFEQRASETVAVSVDVLQSEESANAQPEPLAPALPVMEMHCIPTADIERLVATTGGELIDASPYEVAGSEFDSVRYVVRRTRPTRLILPGVDRSIEITESAPLDSGGVVKHQGLDRPQMRRLDTTSVLEITGWIAWGKEPPHWIEVAHGGRVLREALLTVPRPDVRKVYPDLSDAAEPGYLALIGVAALPREFEITIRAAYKDGRRVPFRMIKGRHLAVLPRTRPRLNPLMVTALGRSGTSWLMRLLARHPEVVIHGSHPYELRMSRYWFHALSVLSQPANERQSLHMDNATSDAWRIGSNPALGPYVRNDPAAFHWMEVDYVDKLADFLCNCAEGLYVTVAGERASDSSFFAEKFLPDHLQNLVWNLYPDAREVILVRDLRDVLASMLAFNEKRGYAAFGRETAPNDRAFVRHLAVSFGALLTAYRERREHVHLIRYEDLIAQPAAELRQLFQYLGADAEPELIDRILTEVQVESQEHADHRTAPTVSSSVSRWERDLSPELKALSAEFFGELLTAFGYQA